ncbi:2-oxoacid:acceptor oxidoreductase subunit alpha [Pontibacillus salicampi]|uniref:2-oxoacid:acceptor oxidoreductase subunit alpha n=1 Tax=Pontibacillus salicampi TaxID=1449801 RepID=A0ABV6LS11_9BACI
MREQLSWKVGGQQGEGIESTGEIFSTALNRLGYYLYGYRHFSSRIKGGHTNNKVRIATKQIRAVSDDLDILVAFDQETIDVNAHELVADGIIIADSKCNPSLPSGIQATLLSVPFTEIASEEGNALMKNMVAIGATCAVMNLKSDIFQEVVAEKFRKKGTAVLENNRRALERGKAYVSSLNQHASLTLQQGDQKRRMFLIGNDAISLGLLAGGCRFMAAYPITPASEIMEYMIEKLPKFGGSVIQTEDEIAAATMAIGANYAGVRTVTASAGPGLSLMMESIGLAGMTETPLVIIDTQRGGPSTGLPTKQEHSDLMAMLYGTHGEIPKIVMAPSTVEEAFYDAVEALNLADEYQCPVILLSDLQLSLGKQTVDPFLYERITIRKGKIGSGMKQDSDPIKRYQVTPDGISTRVLPGTKNSIFHVTGVEHNESGKPDESPVNRKEQMDKRLRKLQNLPDTFKEPVYMSNSLPEADVLLVGFNSTRGVLEEVQAMLEEDGLTVQHAHIRLLHPFPEKQVAGLMDKAKKVIVVENNATGQLSSLIRMHVGGISKLQPILQYDGTPFLPNALYEACKERI